MSSQQEMGSPQRQETRECPFCKEMIKQGAIKCRYCESFLPPDRPAHKGTCPFCKEAINSEAIKCPHCRSDLMSYSGSEIMSPIGSFFRSSPIARAAPGSGSGPSGPPTKRHCFTFWVEVCSDVPVVRWKPNGDWEMAWERRCRDVPHEICVDLPAIA